MGCDRGNVVILYQILVISACSQDRKRNKSPEEMGRKAKHGSRSGKRGTITVGAAAEVLPPANIRQPLDGHATALPRCSGTTLSSASSAATLGSPATPHQSGRPAGADDGAAGLAHSSPDPGLPRSLVASYDRKRSTRGTLTATVGAEFNNKCEARCLQ